MLTSAEIQKMYSEKLVTLDEAAARIKDGDRVYVGVGGGVFKDLDDALSKRINSLKGVELVSLITFPDHVYKSFSESEGIEHVRFASTQYTGYDRAMADAGCSWYVPIMFRELPSYWDIPGNQFDAVMIQARPMDAQGNFNLGPWVGDVFSAIRNSKKVILEINENVPYCHGIRNYINIQDVDCFAMGTNPLPTELVSKPFGDLERQIAGHIVPLIKDGSVLQLGVGALPNCIGSLLGESDVKDLSCYTEMFVDAFVDLYEAGKITGNHSAVDGKMVFTFAGGSRRMYDFLDNNQLACVAPVNFVNDIERIASMDRFVSVNGCLQVDIFGQVAAETIGAKHFSGTGGQMDFVQGAFKSREGQSFIAVSSTRKLKDGRLISNIMPTLPQGTIVTTPRSATHYIATEYGAVNLKGKSTRQRAELLISIAHPDFREELIQAAERMGIWSSSKFTGL